MYYISVLLEPTNNVANIDYNNFLRECNNKLLSDDFIRNRIYYDSVLEQLDGKLVEENKNEFCFIDSLQANPFVINEAESIKIFLIINRGNFICLHEMGH